MSHRFCALLNVLACCLGSLLQAPPRHADAPPEGRGPALAWPLGLGTLLSLVVGCGTTRVSDTVRTATEQLLISNAVDQAVSQIDFRPLAGKTVFFDPQYLDGTVDKGYVVSSLRQLLLASGVVLLEDRAKAAYVVEARCGGIGTDHYSVLVGVPQMSVPTLVPGMPSQIPEIPVAKKSDEQGFAKIAVFAYNRQTGQRVWQSGAVEASSSARDTWVLGLGPFRAGSISRGTEFAGQELPNPLHLDKDLMGPKPPPDQAPVTYAALWPEKPTKSAGTSWLVQMAKVLVGDPFKPAAAVWAQAGKTPPRVGKAPAASADPRPMPTAPVLADMGHAAASPAKASLAGMRVLPDG